MLFAIGVGTGMITGVWAACVWTLRRARGVRPDLLLVGLGLSPIAYFYGADAFGWPTPMSIAVSSGAVTQSADRWLLAGITVGTALVVVAVLVTTGVTRPLERWSRKPE